MDKTTIIVKIRDWVLAFIESLISLLRVLLLSRFFLENKTQKQIDQSLVILGNGPSLKSFLAEKVTFLVDKKTLAVNYFARTEEYTQIKPDYYLIISPEYFRNEQKKEWADDRKLTLEQISKKTDWPMTLMLPSLAKNHPYLQEYFINHPHVSIYFINNAPVDGFKWWREWLFDVNLGLPRPHNVLIPALWFGIKQEFSEIYLTGADHSWLKDLWVTPQNEVLLSQKHFYDQQAAKEATDKNKPTPQPMFHGTSTRTRRLHEVLHKFMVSFQSYWVLAEYAESKRVKIYNLTLDSYIDAFDKREVN